MDKADLFKLMTPAPMDEEERQFRAWLERCSETLSKRDSIEVGELARLVGWSAEIVYRVLSPQSLAAPRSHISNVAALAVFQRTRGIEDPTILESMASKFRIAYAAKKHLLPLWLDMVENYGTGEKYRGSK